MSRLKVELHDVGTVDLDRIGKILAGVDNGIYKATYNALKRAGERAKTEAGRFVSKEYVINKGTFMKNVTVTTDIKGSGGSIVRLNLNFAGSVIELIDFQVSWQRGGTLTAQVKRGGGGTISSAFTARAFTKYGVWQRIGRPRFPIEQLYGPSTAQMMRNDVIVDAMNEIVMETFNDRIEHEVWRLLNGIGI